MVSCKIKKEDVFNSKIAATVMYGLSFFQLGLVLSSLGPIFKDLVEQTSTEMSSLRFFFFFFGIFFALCFFLFLFWHFSLLFYPLPQNENQ